MTTLADTIDFDTLNNETDGEYVIHNINKSIHPVHVVFRKLVNQYSDNLSIDPSSAALSLMKDLQEQFPNVILVKRVKINDEYRYKKYHRMESISKITHVISTKRFNNRKRGGMTKSAGDKEAGGVKKKAKKDVNALPSLSDSMPSVPVPMTETDVLLNSSETGVTKSQDV